MNNLQKGLDFTIQIIDHTRSPEHKFGTRMKVSQESITRISDIEEVKKQVIDITKERFSVLLNKALEKDSSDIS